MTRRQLLLGDWEAANDSLLASTDVDACTHPNVLWLDQIHRPNENARTLELVMGVDLARSERGDCSVIWLAERTQHGQLVCRALTVMRGETFTRQKQVIREHLLSHLPMPMRIGNSTMPTKQSSMSNRLGWSRRPVVAKCLIDQTGLGMAVAEELCEEFPGVVVGVTMHAMSKSRLGVQLADLFRDRRIVIAHDPTLRRDLLSVRQVGWSGSTPIFDAERDAFGHADRFWAAAYAAEASRLLDAGPSPPIFRSPSWRR